MVKGAEESFGVGRALPRDTSLLRVGLRPLLLEEEQIQEKPADGTPSSPASNHLHPPPHPSCSASFPWRSDLVNLLESQAPGVRNTDGNSFLSTAGL